jgi:hypothetical protein
MDASFALFISIFTILILIRLGLNISLSILAGAVFLGLLSIGFDTFSRIIYTSISFETLRLVAIVIAAFTLGYSMEYFGLLKELTSSVSKMTGMLSVPLLPLIVGLLPMPGGALISAVMLTSLIKKYELSPERSTFINYWFRHLWVPVWPLYPSFIVGAAVVDAHYSDVFLATYPIAIAAIFAGAVFTGKLKIKWDISSESVLKLIYSFYPVILVAVMALILKLDLLITLIISLTILFVHKRIKMEDVRPLLKKTIDYKIITLIFAVMIYKDLIEYTNSASLFFQHLNDLSFPPAIAAFILSFLIGFSTGVEISYASIALPLLTGFTGKGELIPQNLMLVFGAGYLGVMLSPIHLCLVFSAEYYKARVYDVYRFLAPTSLLLGVIISILYLIMNGGV